MKQFLTILLLLSFKNLFSQFAIVYDPDGKVNVREDGLANSKVIDQLENGHLIYYFENKGNWSNIDYSKEGKILNGYIYKDRYKLVSGFAKIPLVKETENMVTLKKDSIEVTISQSKFDKTKHSFKYIKEYPDQIELIDHKQYWGLDGGMPTTQYRKIMLKVGQKTISVPNAALQGLYEPGIYTAEVSYDKLTETFTSIP
jgi:hypothetical protein